jgi:hypothetical protein
VKKIDLDAARQQLNCQAGHPRRLARPPPTLVAEFEGMPTPEEIRACADAILSKYDDAPVRSFVLTLADRTHASVFRADRCYALES